MSVTVLLHRGHIWLRCCPLGFDLYRCAHVDMFCVLNFGFFEFLCQLFRFMSFVSCFHCSFIFDSFFSISFCLSSIFFPELGVSQHHFLFPKTSFSNILIYFSSNTKVLAHFLLQQQYDRQCFFISEQQLRNQVCQPLHYVHVFIRETCDGARDACCTIHD